MKELQKMEENSNDSFEYVDEKKEKEKRRKKRTEMKASMLKRMQTLEVGAGMNEGTDSSSSFTASLTSIESEKSFEDGDSVSKD